MGNILIQTQYKWRTDKHLLVYSLAERASKVLVYQSQFKFADALPHWWGVTALGWACLDWKKGVSVFQQLLHQWESAGSGTLGAGIRQPPIPGFLLAGLYETASEESAAHSMLAWAYPRVLDFHRQIYEQQGPMEDGLLVITDFKEELLFPFHSSDEGSLQSNEERKVEIKAPHVNALLVWSNECLIDIGAHLKWDLSELIDWNELTIHSINEQLWDENTGRYQAFDRRQNHRRRLSPWDGFIPLIAEIPDQDQAETMLLGLQELWPDLAPGATSERAEIPKVGCSVVINWLLYHGLWRYGMQSTAERIRRLSLDLMDRFGFRQYYSPDLSESEYVEEAFPPAAALCLDWLHEDGTEQQAFTG